MTEVPVVGFDEVLELVGPERAIERVDEAFRKHAAGEWVMPAKVYLQSPPHGDFRAMPARGEGLAILKWVTSFPGNPAHGRPVVYGTILVSDAATGEPRAIVDGRAVTALRTGAAAAVATRALAKEGAVSAGLIGCGLHGRWAALCLTAAGYAEGICYDPRPEAAEAVAAEVGWTAGTREGALACDVVTLVTPGEARVVHAGELRSGSHLNAMGADGSGKAEMEVDEVLRCKLFCDEWAQASHGGELTGAVAAGRVRQAEVGELGKVLLGDRPGREDRDEITLFDSTGLAIQDLAIVVEVLATADRGPTPTIPL